LLSNLRGSFGSVEGMITEEQSSQAIAEILAHYKKEKKNLIPLLQEVQTRLGYLPRKALQEIADFLEMPDVEVWGVATFYNQFRFVPLGKYHTMVCMGTACHLAGGRLILEALERELDIKVGETAEDGRFSLERVACIGCCMLAPVIVIKDKIYPTMTPFKVEEALISYKQEAQGEPKEGKLKSKS
jgi:NADH-quinone oxidoreductase subunit E